MKKNNFFAVMVFGIVTLSGASFDLQGSEYNNSSALGAAALTAGAIGAYAIANTQTYKDWAKHKADLAEKRAEFENPYEHAQELSINQESKGLSGQERVDLYSRRYEAERKDQMNKLVTKHNYPVQIIEDYQGSDSQ